MLERKRDRWKHAAIPAAAGREAHEQGKEVLHFHAEDGTVHAVLVDREACWCGWWMERMAPSEAAA
jgi:hypothetical protein